MPDPAREAVVQRILAYCKTPEGRVQLVDSAYTPANEALADAAEHIHDDHGLTKFIEFFDAIELSFDGSEDWSTSKIGSLAGIHKFVRDLRYMRDFVQQVQSDRKKSRFLAV
jgi:hypothetical protein